jgi:hypothetical protein
LSFSSTARCATSNYALGTKIAESARIGGVSAGASRKINLLRVVSNDDSLAGEVELVADKPANNIAARTVALQRTLR